MNIKNIWETKPIKQVRGKCENTIKSIESKIKGTYMSKKSGITKDTQDTIKECKDFQKRSEKRFESYYKQKKIIDYIVYVDLIVANILLVVLSYVVFIK